MGSEPRNSVGHLLEKLALLSKNFSGGEAIIEGRLRPLSERKRIGKITRYFHKIGVAAIMLEDSLKVGTKIHIEGATTNFEQEVASMQVDRVEVEEGKSGQEIAIKVKDRVRENDIVYLAE